VLVSVLDSYSEDDSISVCNSRPSSSPALSGTVHTRVEVHRIDLWNDLDFSLCAVPSVCHVVATSDE